MAQRLAQNVNMLCEIGVLDKAVAPELLIDILFFDGLFKILNKDQQDLKSLVSQRDRFGAFEKSLAFYIKAKIVEIVEDSFAFEHFKYFRVYHNSS